METLTQWCGNWPEGFEEWMMRIEPTALLSANSMPKRKVMLIATKPRIDSFPEECLQYLADSMSIPNPAFDSC